MYSTEKTGRLPPNPIGTQFWYTSWLDNKRVIGLIVDANELRVYYHLSTSISKTNNLSNAQRYIIEYNTFKYEGDSTWLKKMK